MGLIDSANAFKRLLNFEYCITLGRKGKSINIRLGFSPSDFYHLAGIQKLKDIDSIQNINRSKFFKDVLDGKISDALIETSKYYQDIRTRIELLAYLEDMLDSDNIYFHYNENINPLSRIEAEYLFSDDIKQQLVFLFVDCDEGEKCFCRSFFPYDDYDYRQKQSKYTLLSKEKIDLRTGKSEQQYTLHSPKIVYRRYSDEVLYGIICNLL